MPADTSTAASSLELAVIAARLEAKLDVALAQHGAKLEHHGMEIGQLRGDLQLLAARRVADPDDVVDHEQRIRRIELRPVLTGRQLAGALTVGAAVLTALSPLVDRLFR